MEAEALSGLILIPLVTACATALVYAWVLSAPQDVLRCDAQACAALYGDCYTCNDALTSCVSECSGASGDMFACYDTPFCCGSNAVIQFPFPNLQGAYCYQSIEEERLQNNPDFKYDAATDTYVAVGQAGPTWRRDASECPLQCVTYDDDECALRVVEPTADARLSTVPDVTLSTVLECTTQRRRFACPDCREDPGGGAATSYAACLEAVAAQTCGSPPEAAAAQGMNCSTNTNGGPCVACFEAPCDVPVSGSGDAADLMQAALKCNSQCGRKSWMACAAPLNERSAQRCEPSGICEGSFASALECEVALQTDASGVPIYDVGDGPAWNGMGQFSCRTCGGRTLDALRAFSRTTFTAPLSQGTKNVSMRASYTCDSNGSGYVVFSYHQGTIQCTLSDWELCKSRRIFPLQACGDLRFAIYSKQLHGGNSDDGDDGGTIVAEGLLLPICDLAYDATHAEAYRREAFHLFDANDAWRLCALDVADARATMALLIFQSAAPVVPCFGEALRKPPRSSRLLFAGTAQVPS